MIIAGGEVTTSAWVDIEQIARGVIRDIITAPYGI